MKTTIAVCNICDQSKAIIEGLGGKIHIARTVDEPILQVTLVTFPEDTIIVPWENNASKYDIRLIRENGVKELLLLQTYCDYRRSILVYIRSED